MGKPAHKLQKEVETCWNSTFDMLSRLYEQREPVGPALVSLRADVAPLSSAEYHTMLECLGVLSPLKDATAELCLAPKVIPLIHSMLRHAISTKQQAVTDEKAAQLCANLLTLMSERLAHYETASHMTLATLLDPRFKTIGFCNPLNAQNAIKRLTAECATKVRETASDHIPEHGETSKAAAGTSGRGLWDLLDQGVMETRKLKSATANATIEVQRYLSEPNIPRSENPLQYWHTHKHIYPHLYMLALGFLCSPASSVPCERVFSKADEVVSKKRNRLSLSTVEKIF